MDKNELPAGLQAYSAIVRGDEPIDPAYAYAKVAAELVNAALDELRDCNGEPTIPASAFSKIAEVRLYLIGLSMAADPNVKTARKLAFPKRPGRPRRSIEKVGDYRRAAHQVIKRKDRGYDAALTEVAKETGLDRTEIEAWAGHIQAELIRFDLK